MYKIPKSDFHIGDIVQIKAASKAYGDKFPQMVVTEVVTEKIDGKTRFKYHCIWFIRSKSWEFKNVWLIGDLLDKKEPKKTTKAIKIGDVSNETGDVVSKIGDVVFLSNFHNEYDIVDPESPKEVQTRFCPPVLTIMGFENMKSQAPSFDNNGKIVREVPSLLVKCLYFNLILNKYSEVLLPKEVLIEAP